MHVQRLQMRAGIPDASVWSSEKRDGHLILRGVLTPYGAHSSEGGVTSPSFREALSLASACSSVGGEISPSHRGALVLVGTRSSEGGVRCPSFRGAHTDAGWRTLLCRRGDLLLPQRSGRVTCQSEGVSNSLSTSAAGCTSLVVPLMNPMQVLQLLLHYHVEREVHPFPSIL